MSDPKSPPLRMRFSYESRCRAVQLMLSGEGVATAAAAAGASRATGYRWWQRFQNHSWAGLLERRSTPHRQPRRLSPTIEAEIVAVRERTNAGPLMVGALLGYPASTVGKVLRRLGRSRLPREPRPPVVRYERARPGDVVLWDNARLMHRREDFDSSLPRLAKRTTLHLAPESSPVTGKELRP